MNQRIPHVFAAAAAFITAIFACDFIEPGECLSEGHLFGPCQHGAISPEGCADGLTCLELPEGWMCVPVGAEAGEDWEVNVCASYRGDLGCSESLNLCALVCDPKAAETGCKGGTVCDNRHGICVYPKEPDEPGDTTTTGGGEGSTGDASTTGAEQCMDAGDSFGSCQNIACGDGLFCHTTPTGSICLPACAGDVCQSACSVAFGVACMDTGLCVQPCGEGCPIGQVCDPSDICVWPHDPAQPWAAPAVL